MSIIKAAKVGTAPSGTGEPLPFGVNVSVESVSGDFEIIEGVDIDTATLTADQQQTVTDFIDLVNSKFTL